MFCESSSDEGDVRMCRTFSNVCSVLLSVVKNMACYAYESGYNDTVLKKIQPVETIWNDSEEKESSRLEEHHYLRTHEIHSNILSPGSFNASMAKYWPISWVLGSNMDCITQTRGMSILKTKLLYKFHIFCINKRTTISRSLKKYKQHILNTSILDKIISPLNSLTTCVFTKRLLIYSGISIKRTHHKADISVRRTVNQGTDVLLVKLL